MSELVQIHSEMLQSQMDRDGHRFQTKPGNLYQRMIYNQAGIREESKGMDIIDRVTAALEVVGGLKLAIVAGCENYQP